MVLVAVQLLVPGLYLPPVFKNTPPSLLCPPQMIISLPVHTAVDSLELVGRVGECWWLSNCRCRDCISRRC